MVTAQRLTVHSSVLPPPQRYPSQQGYNGSPSPSQTVPMIETNNILTSPSGPEYQFLVGEGKAASGAKATLPGGDVHVPTPYSQASMY